MRILIALALLLSLFSGAALAQPPIPPCPPDFDGSGFLPPLLMPGATGQVLSNPPNRVRSAPNTTAEIAFELPPGVPFEVIGGPACSEGVLWWEVIADGQTGWTAESAGGEYFIELLQRPMQAQAEASPNDVPPVPADVQTEPSVVLEEGAEMLKFSQGGVLVVAPDAETNLVDLWDVDTGSRFDMLFPHDPDNIENASNIVFYAENANEDEILTGDVLGRVYVWDAALIEQGRIVTDFVTGGPAPAFATDPDFTSVAVGGCVAVEGDECSIGGVDVFDIASQDGVSRYETEPGSGAVQALAFSTDGAYVAAVTENGVLAVFDVQTGNLLTEVVRGGTLMLDVAFNPADDVLYIGGCRLDMGGLCEVGTVTVVDWATGQVLATQDAHDDALISLDVDAEGARLATAGEEGIIRVWDTDDFAVLTTIDYGAVHVKFVNDFNELGAAGDDSITLWELPE